MLAQPQIRPGVAGSNTFLVGMGTVQKIEASIAMVIGDSISKKALTIQVRK
jgi:hypothetical protein